MWDKILDILIDTGLDGLKTLPFLFAAYLLMEFIEHRSSEKLTHALSHSGKLSVPIGALLGVVPQCGFSVAAANLYGGRIISAGTLLAVFISTSDEALPIIISQPEGVKKLLVLLPVKILLAVLAGYTADYIFFRKRGEVCGEHCHHDDERENAVSHICEHCGCEDHGIFRSALIHTLKTFLFLIAVLLLMNTLTELIGEEQIQTFMLSGSIFQPFVTALVGLIPNCAPSVLLAELYLLGSVSFGGVIAGLGAGAGLGLVMFFRINRDWKMSLKLLLFLYLFTSVSGLLCDLAVRLF